jgi:hypothetical protein
MVLRFLSIWILDISATTAAVWGEYESWRALMYDSFNQVPSIGN